MPTPYTGPNTYTGPEPTKSAESRLLHFHVNTQERSRRPDGLCLLTRHSHWHGLSAHTHEGRWGYATMARQAQDLRRQYSMVDAAIMERARRRLAYGSEVVVDLRDDGTYTIVKDHRGVFTPRNARLYGKCGPTEEVS